MPKMAGGVPKSKTTNFGARDHKDGEDDNVVIVPIWQCDTVSSDCVALITSFGNDKPVLPANTLR
jgi:hypothetical protein